MVVDELDNHLGVVEGFVVIGAADLQHPAAGRGSGRCSAANTYDPRICIWDIATNVVQDPLTVATADLAQSNEVMCLGKFDDPIEELASFPLVRRRHQRWLAAHQQKRETREDDALQHAIP